MSQFISKKDLLSWLSKLAENRSLVAPARVADSILFRKIDSTEEIVFNFYNTNFSPKEFFFPPSEALFSVEKKDGQIKLVPTVTRGEMVIFGIRPCDAKGIATLDLPYLEEPGDALYIQHRKRTGLIGLSCLTACPECFCTSMGTGPDDASNFDIMLTEVEDGYIVQTVTERGKTLLPEEFLTMKDVALPPAPLISLVPSKGITDKMRQAFDNPYWSRLADRCLHCNICSYVCPTCYCFDIRDCTNKGRIDRVRSWESCQSPGFTKIAGGYDPRADKGSRLRQRLAHKLIYFPEIYGPLHCTGCGRCVKTCPVNIDIREIIQDIQKLERESNA